MHLSSNDFEWERNGSSRTAKIGERIRVRILHDDSPGNPIEEHDGHWPMLVKQPGSRTFTTYNDFCQFGERGAGGTTRAWPLMDAWLSWFTDDALVHNQRYLYKLYDIPDDDVRAVCGRIYTQDPNEVRQVLDYVDFDDLDDLEKILEIAGVAHHRETVHGSSQGDWADVLVIAPADLVEFYRGKDVTPEELARDMESQAQLYEDWAFGDCWGYRVEVLPDDIDPDDADETDWTEPDETGCWSCWGYFGDDDRSGIIDQINEVLRYEPVATLIGNLTAGEKADA